MQHIIRCMCY